MKDLLLINSDLPVNFWIEAMDINNYLYNQLRTKRDGYAFILEEALIDTKQNLEHICIFGSRVSTFI